MAKSAEFKADIRKLDHMLKDLRDMQAELLPNETSDKMKEDLKNMDAFGKKKVGLNAKLKDCRDGINRLDEAKRTLAVGQRDQDVIKITAENRNLLKEATTMWTELKEIYVQDENKSGKTKEKEQREERRKKRDKRRRGRKGEEKDDELDDFKDTQPMSAQVQAFMEEKDQAIKEQDLILTEINKGLDDLLHMAEDINKTLKVQDAMLDELGQKIDNNIEAFKTANLKLKHLLKESGGLSRWCPMLICLIILLALLGYIYSMVRGGGL